MSERAIEPRDFTVWRLSSEVWGDVVEVALPTVPGEADQQDDSMRIIWQGMAITGGHARRQAREAGVKPLGTG